MVERTIVTMADFSVKVEGLDKVQRMLHRADAKAALIVGLEFGIKKLQQVAGKYPPTSSANVANDKGRWYERGWGTKYNRADGSVGGKLTSYPLKDGWHTKLFKGGHIRGEVWNDAPYSAAVQGSKRLQNRVHAKRGWKRLNEEGFKLAKGITQKIIKAFKARMK